MRKITKRSAAVGAAVVLTVGATGGAYAAGWLVNGGGIATASTSAIKAMHADVTVTGNVYPGVSTNAVGLVDNPNDFPVVLSGMTLGSITVLKKVGTGVPNPACAATLSSSSFTATLPATAPVIPAGAVDEIVSVPIQVSEDLDALCAGSKITLAFTFTGTSTF